MIPFDPCELIVALCSANVKFIIIGGIAATVHGLARITIDLDVIYQRTPENFDAITSALKPLNPYLRDVPEGLPFVFDCETLARGVNFTLTTAAGPIGFIGTAPGAADYDALLPHCHVVDLCDRDVQVVSLEKLIEMKRGAGRNKDFEVLSMLETLLENSQDNRK